jgi:hypothetical protein
MARCIGWPAAGQCLSSSRVGTGQSRTSALTVGHVAIGPDLPDLLGPGRGGRAIVPVGGWPPGIDQLDPPALSIRAY